MDVSIPLDKHRSIHLTELADETTKGFERSWDILEAESATVWIVLEDTRDGTFEPLAAPCSRDAGFRLLNIISKARGPISMTALGRFPAMTHKLTPAQEGDDGGPAFPSHPETPNAAKPRGMSLRDWFAGQAIAGFLGHPEEDSSPEAVARWAFVIADAMLANRLTPAGQEMKEGEP